MVETPSIVIPPPLAPLPRVEAPILQPPIAAPPRIIPQFQKLSVPAAPRVQMSQPFVPMSKPYYHYLDGRQIFFNIPTLKQRLVPQPVGRHPYCTLSNMVQNFANMLFNICKLNKCLPCLAAITYTMTQVRK